MDWKRQIEKTEKRVPEEQNSTSMSPGEKKAVKKAMNLLLYRDRSVKELTGRLGEAGFEAAEINRAIRYVSSFGYLNDKRYAENYVASYFRKKSRRALIYALREKGIDEIYIEAALSEIPEDETDVIMELLVKKAGTPHRMEEKEIRRCTAFLARKGYAGADIWKVIKTYQNSGEEDGSI
jgi:regulatory protein